MKIPNGGCAIGSHFFLKKKQIQISEVKNSEKIMDGTNDV
jgi:hypothetical protein